MSRIDDAIQDALSDKSRIVTEWVLFAVTQSFDDEDSTGGYIAGFRPGMLPHHVSGLVEAGVELLDEAHGELED